MNEHRNFQKTSPYLPLPRSMVSFIESNLQDFKKTFTRTLNRNPDLPNNHRGTSMPT
ncbi:hypothetical protein COLO4_35411 [Corchorus olitorius]|uniref:Uncharacterized protein n=1 Tax=Corchorus olitorius TaxID=93759 RepID=A0A1R3GH22_9ROSI|nr:hypothetical protein COLO4_35411 [Corchorus olitorius]